MNSKFVLSFLVAISIVACGGVPTPPIICSPPAGMVPVPPGAVYTYRLPAEALTYTVSFSDLAVRVSVRWDDPNKVTFEQSDYPREGVETEIAISPTHNGRPVTYEILRVYHCRGQWWMDDTGALWWQGVTPAPTPTPEACQAPEGFVQWISPLYFYVYPDLWISMTWNSETYEITTVIHDGKYEESGELELEPGYWDAVPNLHSPRYTGDLAVVLVRVCPDGQAYYRIYWQINTPEAPQA